MRQYTVRQFQHILDQNGFRKVRQRSSHQIWQRNGESITLPVANLRSVVCLRLIKEYHLLC